LNYMPPAEGANHELGMGSDGRQETGFCDFLLDIANEFQRPHKSRVAMNAIEIQNAFYDSPFFTKINIAKITIGDAETSEIDSNSAKVGGSNKNCIALYNPSTRHPKLALEGWKITTLSVAVRRSMIVLERAFIEKIRNVEIIKRQFSGNLVMSLFMGYFLWSQGTDYGSYCMNMLQSPYPQVANLTASFFFIEAFALVAQVLNVHAIVQKHKTYARQRNTIPPMAFGLSSILVELVVAIPCNIMFCYIYYYMTSVKLGSNALAFLIQLQSLTVIYGVVLAHQLTALLGKELMVRDAFLIIIFITAFLSGYAFLIPSIRSSVATATQIVPMRWMFEGLMIWKFGVDCIDGEAYLKTFGFGYSAGHKEYILGYLLYFIAISLSLYLLSLLPLPGRLWVRALSHGDDKHRMSSRGSLSSDRGSMDLSGSSQSSRSGKLVPPIVFSRGGSVTSEVSLAITLSVTGEEINKNGGTIAFKNLHYIVKDPKSPSNSRTVLHNVTGNFSWGRLSVVMGSAGSGKSSLLGALAGVIRQDPKSLTGSITYNKKRLHRDHPIWQLCGYVESVNHFGRDTTVYQCVLSAMELRCNNRAQLAVAKANVEKTLLLLELVDVRHKKSKQLTRGEQKRLAIAQEIVHGPGLIILDEPITEIDIFSVSVIMKALRDLVNQDRTVVMSVHEPSPALFDRTFDKVMLMSNGRIIYHGSAGDAKTYFGKSGLYSQDMMKNAPEFLLGLSACEVKTVEGTVVNSLQLADMFNKEEQRQKERLTLKDSNYESNIPGRSVNPMHSGDSENDKESIMKGPISEMDFEKYDWDIFFVKMYVLLRRSFYNTLTRKQLLIGSTLSHAITAIFLGIVCGDTETNVYNTTSFMILSTLLLMLLNVQQVFFCRSVYEVYESETLRGLYHPIQFWLSASLPMYSVRVINALIFSVIAYSMLNFKKGREAYYILSISVTVIAAFVIAESIGFYVGRVRGGYLAVPAVSVVSFFFSGMPVRASTLPDWVAPWGPSISLIRWQAQSSLLNEFNDDSTTFPTTVSTSTFQVNPYAQYLAMFGWGGKSKWYCIDMILVMIVFFKVIQLCVLVIKPMLNREYRHLRKNDSL